MRYKSCESIENNLNLFANRRSPACCFNKLMGKSDEALLDYGDYDNQSFNYLEARNRLREANQGEVQPCAGCPMLHEQEWTECDYVRTIHIATSLRCNLSCCYCSCYDNSPLPYCSVLPHITRWVNEGLIAPEKTTFLLSGGEPLINPDTEALLRLATDNANPVSLISNSVCFSQTVLNLAGSGLLQELRTSIDAGTRECYRRTRGYDGCDTVWENLSRYLQAAPLEKRRSIVAQYILMDHNCACSEIDRFAERVEKSGIQSIRLELDISDPCTIIRDSSSDENLLNASSYFINRMRQINDVTVIMPTVLNRGFHDAIFQRAEMFMAGRVNIVPKALEGQNSCLKIVHNTCNYLNSMGKILDELKCGRDFAVHVKGQNRIQSYPDYFLALAKICSEDDLRSQPTSISYKCAAAVEKISGCVKAQLMPYHGKYSVSFLSGKSAGEVYHIYFSPCT